MTSDDARTSGKDLTAIARPPGPGMHGLFLCAGCGRHKEISGRKLQRVRGLRTWVCKGCAK